MRTCQDIQQLLPGYGEGLLSPEEKQALEDHLSSCVHCRRNLADLTMTRKALKNLEEVEPPPFFEQRIMTRVREEAERKRGFIEKVFFPLPIKIPLQALAMVLIALLSVYIYQKNEGEMKQISPLTVPLGEPTKGSEGNKPSPTAKVPSRTIQPGRMIEEGTSFKKDQPQFAPAPPPVVGPRDEVKTADPAPQKQEEKPAAEKAKTPVMALGDKEESPNDRPVLNKTQERIERSGSDQALVASHPERKKKGSTVVLKSPLAGKETAVPSAAPSARAMESAVRSPKTLDLTVQVRETDGAVQKIEVQLRRTGARILERKIDTERPFLKVEIPVSTMGALLDDLEAIGQVGFDRKTLEHQEGQVTLSIRILRRP